MEICFHGKPISDCELTGTLLPDPFLVQLIYLQRYVVTVQWGEAAAPRCPSFQPS